MNHFYGYIRVSAARQGEGVSLQQQRAAIEQYAQRHSLEISRWFEELETAAKSGRPLFSEMIKQLKRGSARGVIIHKIDRSARNLRDWADLGELIDHGTEVHFANETLDLHTRGGRLSADIQAVVAADYIRNLREKNRPQNYYRTPHTDEPISISTRGEAGCRPTSRPLSPRTTSAISAKRPGKVSTVASSKASIPCRRRL